MDSRGPAPGLPNSHAFLLSTPLCFLAELPLLLLGGSPFNVLRKGDPHCPPNSGVIYLSQSEGTQSRAQWLVQPDAGGGALANEIGGMEVGWVCGALVRNFPPLKRNTEGEVPLTFHWLPWCHKCNCQKPRHLFCDHEGRTHNMPMTTAWKEDPGLLIVLTYHVLTNPINLPWNCLTPHVLWTLINPMHLTCWWLSLLLPIVEKFW